MLPEKERDKRGDEVSAAAGAKKKQKKTQFNRRSISGSEEGVTNRRQGRGKNPQRIP